MWRVTWGVVLFRTWLIWHLFAKKDGESLVKRTTWLGKRNFPQNLWYPRCRLQISTRRWQMIYQNERQLKIWIEKSKITKKQLGRSEHMLLRYCDRKLFTRDTCVQAHLPVIQNHIHTVASHHTVDAETLPTHAVKCTRHLPRTLRKYR